MKRLSEFETIEEFWGTVDNVPPPSKLPVGCNYHLCVSLPSVLLSVLLSLLRRGRLDLSILREERARSKGELCIQASLVREGGREAGREKWMERRRWRGSRNRHHL